MKSNYITTNRSQWQKLAVDVAKQEIETQKRELCPECQLNTAYQVLATVFTVLMRRNPRWTAKAINAIKDDVEAEFDLMTKGFLGRDYTANSLIQALKEEGIDLEHSVFDDRN